MANVTLNEDFNSLSSIWSTVHPWSPSGFSGGDMGSWLANPALLPANANPVSIDNGVLTLSDFARPDNVSADAIGGRSRIAGQVVTQNSFVQTYGYFEGRIQMPAGNGELGAFWLMPQNGGWPPELDVAEVIGNSPNTLVNTIHGDGAPGPHWTDVADMTQGFHTYAVDWKPDTVTWYFDGQQTFQTATPSDMHQPMYLIASTTSGQPGSWQGPADPSSSSHMKIDYIRAYDANPYTSGGAVTQSTDNSSSAPSFAAPADGSTPADTSTPLDTSRITNQASQATTSNDATVVNIGRDTLWATGSSDLFQFDGANHQTTIQDFNPAFDKLDFEMTAQDFSGVTIAAARDGHARIYFDGNRVSLPGITPDQLSQDNFLFNAHSNANSTGF